MLKPIGMPWGLFTGPETQRFPSMGVRKHATFIGPSLWRNTPNSISSTNCKTNKSVFASSIGTHPLCSRPRRGTSPSKPGGLRLTAPLRKGWNTFSFGWSSGTFDIDNGVALCNWCVFSVITLCFLFHLIFPALLISCTTIPLRRRKSWLPRNLHKCPIATLPNPFTTNGFKRPATRVAISTWPLWMTIFEPSPKLWHTINYMSRESRNSKW